VWEEHNDVLLNPFSIIGSKGTEEEFKKEWNICGIFAV
jgi:hypothetical protein